MHLQSHGYSESHHHKIQEISLSLPSSSPPLSHNDDIFCTTPQSLLLADGVGGLRLPPHNLSPQEATALPAEIVHQLTLSLLQHSHSHSIKQLICNKSSQCQQKGASTFVALSFNQGYLSAFNVGDSGWYVLRRLGISGRYVLIAQSRACLLEPNKPLQLSTMGKHMSRLDCLCGCQGSEKVHGKRWREAVWSQFWSAGDYQRLLLKEDDIVLCFSDGFSDNVGVAETLHVVNEMEGEGREKKISKELMRRAFKWACCKPWSQADQQTYSQKFAENGWPEEMSWNSPWVEEWEKRHEGQFPQGEKRFRGGKPDDITVICAIVRPGEIERTNFEVKGNLPPPLLQDIKNFHRKNQHQKTSVVDAYTHQNSSSGTVSADSRPTSPQLNLNASKNSIKKSSFLTSSILNFFDAWKEETDVSANFTTSLHESHQKYLKSVVTANFATANTLNTANTVNTANTANTATNASETALPSIFEKAVSFANDAIDKWLSPILTHSANPSTLLETGRASPQIENLVNPVKPGDTLSRLPTTANFSSSSVSSPFYGATPVASPYMANASPSPFFDIHSSLSPTNDINKSGDATPIVFPGVTDFSGRESAESFTFPSREPSQDRWKQSLLHMVLSQKDRAARPMRTNSFQLEEETPLSKNANNAKHTIAGAITHANTASVQANKSANSANNLNKPKKKKKNTSSAASKKKSTSKNANSSTISPIPLLTPLSLISPTSPSPQVANSPLSPSSISPANTALIHATPFPLPTLHQSSGRFPEPVKRIFDEDSDLFSHPSYREHSQLSPSLVSDDQKLDAKIIYVYNSSKNDEDSSLPYHRRRISLSSPVSPAIGDVVSLHPSNRSNFHSLSYFDVNHCGESIFDELSHLSQSESEF